MDIRWSHAAPSILAAFCASFVEFVEALTVILAVGSIRGWRSALSGTSLALVILLGIVAALGPTLAHIPIGFIQIIVGALLLLFGLRWLRKAILRAAGVIPLHDEKAAFAKESARLRALGDQGLPTGGTRLDAMAFATSFQITMLEGMEVVFIVIAIGAGGTGLLIPASLGALAALVVVATLGIAIHRPLANIPENTLKFAVGVLLSGFGTFWMGEGLAISWPGGDWAVLALSLGFLITALATLQLCRARLPKLEPI